MNSSQYVVGVYSTQPSTVVTQTVTVFLCSIIFIFATGDAFLEIMFQRTRTHGDEDIV